MKRKQYRGFTIVELLVVIAAIGILAAIIMVSYGGVQQNARRVALQSDLRSTADGIALYANSHKGIYPSDLSTIPSSENSDIRLSYFSGTSSFCLEGIVNDTDIAFYITEADRLREGACPVTLSTTPAYPVTSNYCFSFQNSTNTILGYFQYEQNNSARPACPKDLVIPSVLGGVAVRTIGSGAFAGKQLTSVYIPSSVTTIAASAFNDNLISSVNIGQYDTNNIPPAITSIAMNAFADNSFSSIRVPRSTTLDPAAFSDNVTITRY